MTFDEASSIFVLVMAAVLLGWRYRPRVFLGRLGVTIRHAARLFIMVSFSEDAQQKDDMDAVYIPVSHTGMDAHTTPKADDITDDFEMPRIGRRLSDPEIIALLATQKGVDGDKHRFTANQIVALVGGDRNTVLRQIKTIRDGPPAPQVREHQTRLAQLQTANEQISLTYSRSRPQVVATSGQSLPFVAKHCHMLAHAAICCSLLPDMVKVNHWLSMTGHTRWDNPPAI